MELDGERLVEDLECEDRILRGPLVFLCELMDAVCHGQAAGVELCTGEERSARLVEDGVVGEDRQDVLACLPFGLAWTRNPIKVPSATNGWLVLLTP